MKELRKSINDWVKKNKGDVMFIGSFCEFDKNGEVKDDFIGAYGVKKCIKLSLGEMSKLLKKEKSDFINW